MEFELNLYGTNDEIIKTYSTAHVRWSVFIKAVQLQERLKNADAAEQFKSISEFMMTLFDGMTEAELEKADAFDVMAVFQQLINKAKNINSGSKNE